MLCKKVVANRIGRGLPANVQWVGEQPVSKWQADGTRTCNLQLGAIGMLQAICESVF